MSKKTLVLVTEPIDEIGLQLLGESCDLRTPWTRGSAFNDEDLKEADAIIVRSVPVTASLICKSPKLKVIGRHGAGLDSVDLNAATLRRIPVIYTPFVTANAVAEHAVHLMLSLARQTLAADEAVRKSRFDIRDSLIGFELRDTILGIVGLGAVGMRVAEICHKGFEMKVVAFDPFAQLPASLDFVRRIDSLRELLQQADIVTLHTPLTSETHHLINSESLGWMKCSALLINTARGAIIDTRELAFALNSGRLMGVALDVFEVEPLPADHPLQSAPRVLFSPHNGGATREARKAMSELVARQVLQVLHGERPKFLANPEVFEARSSVDQIPSLIK